MEFKFDVSEEKIQKLMDEIGQKKLQRIISQELAEGLDTLKLIIKQSVKSAVIEMAPVINEQVRAATMKFIEENEVRIEETLIGLMKERLETSRAVHGMSFHLNLKRKDE